jgi:crossover junction endodeoxyribonuclease RuvC
VTLVLGIDPGSKFTGYGLVAKEKGRLIMVSAGRIRTKAGAPLPVRLREVYEGLQDVLTRHSPDIVSVEDVFFAKNVRSAVRLGHVRGVALLAAANAGLEVAEYPPASIKCAVVGYGQADKKQVCLMVRQILRVKEELPEDAADALAAAICHLSQTPALLKETKS